MDDFENTNLYRGCVGKYGKRKDWDEILENLCQVFQHRKVRVSFNSVDIDEGFIWGSTQQGYDYWRTVFLNHD